MKPLKKKKLNRLLASLADEKEYVFLDNVRGDDESQRSILFLRTEERLDFYAGDSPDNFLKSLEQELKKGKYLAGWFGYEFGYLLEPQLTGQLPPSSQNSPLVSFGVFSEAIIYDHGEDVCPFPQSSLHLSPDFAVSNKTESQTKEEYLKAIHRIKEYIAAGDSYQVNYTLNLLFDFSGSVESFYAHLRNNQSVAYGAMMRLGGEYILSLSPELFFRVDENRVMVRPMKGTMQRGRNLTEDTAFCDELSKDPKNRSENVMIVDLLRNDLGRLTHKCGDNRVITKSLFDVERYESVLQMTSTIYTDTETNVFSRVALEDFLKALFPCGSVTGAPKVRTMEIIRELEPQPRGVYTGAIGYFSPDGDAVFNVPIRTVHLRDGKGKMGIGSGIVQDSDPEQEWQECLLKAHFLTKSQPVFSLFETLLLEGNDRYWLLDYHLQRLRQSAEYFLFSYDEQWVLQELEQVKRENRDAFSRVRLSLQKDGEVFIESAQCESPKERCLSHTPKKADAELPLISLSARRVDSTSPFFFHKSSQRKLFQEEFVRARQEGLFDILFCNERGELTEGCITNLILHRDGQYVTPKLSSALLAGTMRRKLLEDTDIPVVEQTLTLQDLQ
ncbi:MAG: aminodeoxychorismate synthase component I, partial [Desulfocapsa sp.]